MPFLPDTPITIAYAAALVVACVLGLRGGAAMAPAVAVMVVNWLGTRAVTAWDLPGVAAAIVDLSSAAVLLVAWTIVRTMALLPVAAIFGLMLLSYIAFDLGFVGRETMWAFADVGGYIQLIIVAAGGLFLGGGKRLAMDHRRGGGNDSLAGPVALRIPIEPNS